LKRRTSRAMWVIRAVTVTITVLVVLVIVTFSYSGYVDYKSVTADLSGPTRPAAVAKVQGQAEAVSLNVTIPNPGLYALKVSVSCSQPTASWGLSCSQAIVAVPAREKRVLQFSMTVSDLTAFESSLNQHISGTLGISLMPFAALTFGIDLGSLAQVGNGQDRPYGDRDHR